MKTLTDSQLLSSLKDSTVFIDANVIIGAISYPQLIGKFIGELKQVDSIFLTIPSVVYEVSRGAKDLDDYNKIVKLIKSMASTYPIERHLEGTEAFTVVMQRVKGTASYSDILLSTCLFRFPSAYLFTGDHNDFPLEVLDRIHLVTFDTDKEIKNFGFYKLSDSKYQAAAQKILRSNY